jgi:hypothetical protein
MVAHLLYTTWLPGLHVTMNVSAREERGAGPRDASLNLDLLQK